jgi:predicted DNA-binding ribbon-helix-helix protein
MQAYTKRLQILLPPVLWDRLQILARERRVSVATLIRNAVEQAYFAERPSVSPLDAVQQLAAMRLPVADWEQMEAESTTGGCDAGLD